MLVYDTGGVYAGDMAQGVTGRKQQHARGIYIKAVGAELAHHQTVTAGTTSMEVTCQVGTINQRKDGKRFLTVIHGFGGTVLKTCQTQCVASLGLVVARMVFHPGHDSWLSLYAVIADCILTVYALLLADIPQHVVSGTPRILIRYLFLHDDITGTKPEMLW